LTSIAIGLMCLGCLLLSLSLRRHYRQVFADDSLYEQRRWSFRISGYLLVALALWPCVREFDAPIGICLWLSVLALASFLQVMLLTYRPRDVTVLGFFGVLLLAAGLLP
jgi:hypothetical protein